ncbi:MAG: aminoglycoside N(6')acetyltransferase [uncultured bacterium]|nr:MAG: aminoglycoside N(6')acetyltransferase [uncultured bacterium]
MNQTSYRFNFKPADKSQCELVHEWLKQDYISKWIHGQGLKNTLSGLEKFTQYHAPDKEHDRELTITQHWIGYDGDKPFVYLLTSNIFKNSGDEYTKYSETSGPFITLDIFICDQQYLGKGLATTIIKQFLLSHFSDISEVFIDPEQSNERAIHVYQKARFRLVGEFIAEWHSVPHYIMKLKMKDL